MQNEVWREAPFAPGYLVSDMGRVKRLRDGAIMAQRLQKRGKLYRCVSLRIDGRSDNIGVHRAVAMTFLGPPPTPKHHAAHNDGDPTNNQLENLRWATPAENIADRALHGTTARGPKNGQTKLSQDDAIFIKKSDLSCAKLAVRFGVNPTTIWRIKTGENWSYLSNSIAAMDQE